MPEVQLARLPVLFHHFNAYLIFGIDAALLKIGEIL
jgi:hypothetical protein